MAISPDRRGFLFADGVYEVVRAYQGRFFKLPEHFDRLAYGLKELRIDGVDARALEPVIYRLLKENGGSFQWPGPAKGVQAVLGESDLRDAVAPVVVALVPVVPDVAGGPPAVGPAGPVGRVGEGGGVREAVDDVAPATAAGPCSSPARAARSLGFQSYFR